MVDPVQSALATSASGRASASRLGVVAIGRNEGERLKLCLQSVVRKAEHMVYVDSGSTDGSPEAARGIGARVVALDMSRPFTAARARNEGWRSVVSAAPDLEYVQFVDGDCEVVAGWLEDACAFLDAHPEVAAVAGRNRERFPERSIYNLMCDIEWASGAIGSTRFCGGNVMMRVAALRQSGGFRDSLIAGEEPELCVRLRAAGWLVWRLGREMTLHDASMTRFGQWWKRAMRTGFSYAEGALLHGRAPERLWVRESRSAWLWGVALPVLLIAGAFVAGPWVLLGFLLYPAQVLRLFLRTGGATKERLLRSAFLVIAKLPEVAGQLKFLAHRLSGTHGRLIEYK